MDLPVIAPYDWMCVRKAVAAVSSELCALNPYDYDGMNPLHVPEWESGSPEYGHLMFQNGSQCHRNMHLSRPDGPHP
ncbi:MAG: hypothetical protein JJU41_07195 [Bacteroidetes bacterium]|nr:hypothetical protein [Bacteroidota bacterium]MCH8525206.1 hypothetical protein [Balneolales bacterium]